MKEMVNEILSDFKDAPKPNTDIAGSIFILNETKAKLESNFLFRYVKAGMLVSFEIFFVFLALSSLVFGVLAISEANEVLNNIQYPIGVIRKDITPDKVKEKIMVVKISFSILILIIVIFFYLLSRVFRRSRKRIFLLKATCDNINQVIVNLKAVKQKD